MQSAALNITLAVQALLTSPSMANVADDAIYIEPIFPADLQSNTALNIELGDEPTPELGVISLKDRSVSLKLTAMATGASAVMKVDKLMVEAHLRLMADETLGGLCFEIQELNTERENATNGKRLAVISKNYLVTYRTTEQEI